MNDIADFVKRRRVTVLAAIEPLREQAAEINAKIRELEAELKQLDQVARTLGMVNGLDELSQTRRRPKSELTIKEAALQVLADFPDGLTALALLREINIRFGFELVRTSLSPQLSRLKRDGMIADHQSVWRLTQPPLRAASDQ